MKITFSQAKQFLEDISPKDRVAIIHHNDLDGFASGILFYNWCKNRKAKVKNFIFTYGDDPRKIKIKKFNKVILTDLAPGAIESLKIDLTKDKKIFYTDHHPEREKIPAHILEFRTTEKHEPSSRPAYELTEIKSWLALAGLISDAGELYAENKKFISKELRNSKMNLQVFRKEVAEPLENLIVYYKKNLQKAFKKIEKIKNLDEVKKIKKYSKKIEQAFQEYEKDFEKNNEKIGNVNLYSFNPKYDIKTLLINKISRTKPHEVFIFLSPKSSNQNLLGLSARHQSLKADLPTLLAKAMKGFENANSGGHKRASGGQIQKKDLDKFKENLKKFSE